MAKFISNFLNDDEVTDEIFLARLRHWRDGELKATDWTQVEDAPINKAAWAQYRQELRDLPQSNKNPREIQLPTKP